MHEAAVHGEVHPAFAEVRDVFIDNIAKGREIGAAVAVYHRGVKVVDLWGGLRDETTRAPWEEDTLTIVFSSSKGMAAATLALAHSRGRLDYDAKVAKYWPEFAQNGKAEVTVRQLLSHQAGLCCLDTPLTPEILADHDWLAEILAAQKPAWQPGARHGYHAVSLGFYEGELLRRVDPEHRTLGQFFQEEIAAPLGLDFYIGLPRDIPERRLAAMKGFKPLETVLEPFRLSLRMVLAFIDPQSITSRTFRNPDINNPVEFATPVWRHVQMPASNGFGTARSLAKAYGCLAMGGKELGLKEETMRVLTAPPITPVLGTRDRVMFVEAAYSLGYLRPFPSFNFGSSPRAFGTPGCGGSFGFADPDRQLGFAYVMNKMSIDVWEDPRQHDLRLAVYRCLRNVK
ncbi:MAG TPA: serine hydrolase domain-containing protein [bacterium]|nr:serine hydrolase domain-containing protein [bacterium]